MKYREASPTISGEPPSHIGRLRLIAMPQEANRQVNMKTVNRPFLSRLLAASKSFAPHLWATCTEKPDITAMKKPFIIQVLVDTSPIEAAGFAPRWPTMDASMYCISTDEIWARMAGMARSMASLNCCPSVIGSLFLISPNSSSLLSFIRGVLMCNNNKKKNYKDTQNTNLLCVIR